MPEANSDNKKAATLPTSSWVTLRRKQAFCAEMLNNLLKSAMPAAASVFIGPAEMPLTRMPSLPRCLISSIGIVASSLLGY